MDYFDEKGRKLEPHEVTSPVRGLTVRAVRVETVERSVVDGVMVERSVTVTQHRPVYDADGRPVTVLASPLRAR